MFLVAAMLQKRLSWFKSRISYNFLAARLQPSIALENTFQAEAEAEVVEDVHPILDFYTVLSD